MRGPRPHRTLTWLVALTLLVQAMAFGWMRPAEAAEASDVPPIDGWVICTAHAEAAPPAAPAKDANKSAARHDLTCTMCAGACVMAPAAILADGIALPVPRSIGRIERIAAASLQPRAPPFALPTARGPPPTFPI